MEQKVIKLTKLFKKKTVLQYLLVQRGGKYPSGHVQSKLSSGPLIHVPLLRHGLGMHGSSVAVSH